MFRPDTTPDPGDPITLDLAPSGDCAMTAIVTPITGAHEMWLTNRRRMPGRNLETLVLSAGMVRVAGQVANPDGFLVGDRNRLILAVLCAGFGAPRDLVVTCATCDAVQEVPFDPGPVLATQPQGPAGQIFAIQSGDGLIQMRLPTGGDVAQAGTADALLDRCAQDCGTDPAIIGAVEAEISERDPCSEITYPLDCVACGAPLPARLDPLVLLRAELDRYGGVLAELDQIARAYHWSEAELLALPACRRRLYLQALDAQAFDAHHRRAS